MRYSDGRLASLTGGTLNYGFGYTADTGELASVSKNAASVENHAYDRQNGETTVTSGYPDSTGALYTETKVFDQYGRLKSIDGVLENLYKLDSFWVYSYGKYAYPTMENYNGPQIGELSYGTIVKDGKDGVLAQITDKLAGEVTKYGYANEKLTAAVTYDESDDTILKVDTFVYDIAGRLIKTRFDHNPLSGEYVTSEIGYLKEADDPLADNTVNCYSYKVNGTEKAKTENTYDAYKRIKNKKYTVDGKVFTKGIEYDKTRVKKVVDSAGGTTSYEYDCMGRISIEKDANNSILKSYVYDSYGQLIRENNKSLDKTFVYEYNTIGNIVTVKTYNYTTGSLGTVISQQNFSYDSTHPDRLLNCGSGSISYNGMGCPVTYNGYSVSWSRGKLSRLSKGSLTEGIHDYYFSYNAFGQRTHRSYTYNLPTSEPFEVALGMVMNYSQEFCYDQAGRLICESKSSEYYQSPSISDKIVYLYDADSISGIVYTENGETDTYYFQRNLFGDVVGIYDVNGTKVGGYAYDAWGKCTITLNTKSVVTRNPIRYRGYYYDQDTGLYYLNARYYSPEWRRFISPDDTAYLDSETPNGLNLYVYCYNDPVTYVDGSGCSPWWSWLVSGLQVLGGIALCFVPGAQGIGVGFIVGGTLGLISNAVSPAIAQAIGGASSIVNGAGAFSTGMSILGLGIPGLIGGVALMGIGVATMAFGANEIVAATTGTNYIQQWTGMSDTVYGWTYFGLNLASSIGQVAGIRYRQIKTRTAIYNPDGSVKQYRYYRNNGNKLYDIDFNHPAYGNPKIKFPHYHGWTNAGIRAKEHQSYIELIIWLLLGGR